MRIMLPEMAMLILPAAFNMLIIMLKETAVLSIITVPELTFKISAIGSEKYAFVESLSMLAIIYWAMVEFCGYLGRLAERKVQRYGYTNH
jgi:polar amino acid transport system permease protein